MKQIVLACLLMAGACQALADDAPSADAVVTPAEPFTGWHWYNEPKKKPIPLHRSLSPRRRCRTSAGCHPASRLTC